MVAGGHGERPARLSEAGGSAERFAACAGEGGPTGEDGSSEENVHGESHMQGSESSSFHDIRFLFACLFNAAVKCPIFSQVTFLRILVNLRPCNFQWNIIALRKLLNMNLIHTEPRIKPTEHTCLLASIQPRTGLVKFARFLCTDRAGSKASKREPIRMLLLQISG